MQLDFDGSFRIIKDDNVLYNVAAFLEPYGVDIKHIPMEGVSVTKLNNFHYADIASISKLLARCIEAEKTEPVQPVEVIVPEELQVSEQEKSQASIAHTPSAEQKNLSASPVRKQSEAATRAAEQSTESLNPQAGSVPQDGLIKPEISPITQAMSLEQEQNERPESSLPEMPDLTAKQTADSFESPAVDLDQAMETAMQNTSSVIQLNDSAIQRPGLALQSNFQNDLPVLDTDVPVTALADSFHESANTAHSPVQQGDEAFNQSIYEAIKEYLESPDEQDGYRKAFFGRTFNGTNPKKVVSIDELILFALHDPAHYRNSELEEEIREMMKSFEDWKPAMASDIPVAYGRGLYSRS